MHSWLRKELGWLVLAVTLLSLPGPASKACACARMTPDAQSAMGCASSSASQVGAKACPRCQAAVGAPVKGRAQISRVPCCKSKVTESSAAETPAKLQIERPETPTAAHSAVSHPPALRNTGTRGTRAPPPRAPHDAAAPPASYLSDYLRL